MRKKDALAAALVMAFLCGVMTGRAVPGLVYAQEFREEADSAGTQQNTEVPDDTGEQGEDGGDPDGEEDEKGYVIRFHEDFDTDSDGLMEQTVLSGETVNLLPVPWTHEGYVFAGWYAAGYGVNHALANAYADGAPVRDLTEEDGGVIDLYAGWCREKE